MEASWASSMVGDGLGSELAVHGTHGRRAPDGLGFLLGVVRAREGAGEAVGSGVEVARPVGWSPPQGRHGGMVTGAVSPDVDDQRRFGWVPVPNWLARQVRGVDGSSMVQGIQAQATESIDLILFSSVLGKNRVVLTTCSTKCVNQIQI